MRLNCTIYGAFLLCLGMAPTPANAADKDAKAIQGTWQVVSAEDSGRKSPADTVKNQRIVIGRGKMSVKDGDRTVFEVKYKIDSSKKPKWIDLTPVRKGQAERTSKGIYELKGDSLKICFPERKTEERANKFESKKGSVNDILLILKRHKS